MTIEENKREADDEASRILYKLSSREMIKDDYVEDYFSKMQKLKANILDLCKDRESFNNNYDEIRNFFLNLGSLFFCFYYRIKEMKTKYSTNLEIINPFCGLQSFPGCHDFNVCLGRYFSYELYEEFYKIWLEDISVFLDSKGGIIPRYIHVINCVKKENNQDKKYLVMTFIFLRKEDLGWDPPPYLELKGIERTKEKLNAFLEYKKNWLFTDCALPNYFCFYNKCPKKDSFEKLYKKVFGNDKYRELYEEFLKKEYCIFEYVCNNYSYFKNLNNYVISFK